MTATRKDAARRLSVEIGARKLALEAAKDENERAFRSGDLAILFLDNLDFIQDYLAGVPVGTKEVSLRTLKDS